MKLTAKQDIEAPAPFLLAQITDFEGWERAAMRRGAEVVRLETGAAPSAVGTVWQTRFRYRGRDRDLTIRLDRMDAEGALAFSVNSPKAEGLIAIEIMSLSPRRSRMHVSIEVKPLSFTARLVIQSMKLARARVDRSFRDRARKFADEIEERWRRAAPH